VRLPKDCRPGGEDVLVFREGERVIIEPAERSWSPGFRRLVGAPPDDSMPPREQPRRGDRRRKLG